MILLRKPMAKPISGTRPRTSGSACTMRWQASPRISNCRSRADRTNTFDTKASNDRPAENSCANRTAVNASNKCFGSRLDIDRLTGRIDCSPQVGVLDRTIGHQIDPAFKERFECVAEAQETTGHRYIGADRKARDEIVVARYGVKRARCRRAEHFQ